jgi:hypothetical protein
MLQCIHHLQNNSLALLYSLQLAIRLHKSAAVVQQPVQQPPITATIAAEHQHR